jgi:hypothetical protein
VSEGVWCVVVCLRAHVYVGALLCVLFPVDE